MLKEKAISFVGGGQMSEAIFAGALKAGALTPGNVTVTDILPQRLEDLRQQYGVKVVENDAAGSGIATLAKSCDMLVLAVKPQLACEVLGTLGHGFPPSVLVVSIIGGLTLDTLAGLMPGSPLVRVLPNTPLMVGKGSAALVAGPTATQAHLALCRALFGAAGQTVQLPERLANAYTAVSGCGPAFAYLLAEALAAGGVQQGLSHQVALDAAAEMMAGAAEMIQQTGRHPAQLRDSVCSPGGGTIAGVRALEDGGFRAAVMDAVEQARKRMDELG